MNTDIYKQRLEEDLTNVHEQLATLGIHNPENPSDWTAIPEDMVGEADGNVAADRVEDWNERRAILGDLEKRYNNIHDALKKIEKGTYGTCEIGNEPIDEKRLQAHPAARTCTLHMEDNR